MFTKVISACPRCSGVRTALADEAPLRLRPVRQLRVADWSLTSLQLKLIKIGASVVRHARAITFQLAEVAVTGAMVRAILAAIRRLRAQRWFG
ncbi:MAG: transposase [Paracoccus sp. (in: a-proteobacteria)]|uniref:transposase n=1 Tax=Paracoccus sp. TaxID=267 RepID=UPI0039188C1E